MKDALAYFKLANGYGTLDKTEASRTITLRLITNFTDTPLQKILVGMCLEEGIYPIIETVPYKQYQLYLKDKERNPTTEADLTFVFLDVHNYVRGAFHAEDDHFDEILADIDTFSTKEKGPVVMSTFPLPYQNTYGNLFDGHGFYARTTAANTELHSIASHNKNLYIWDINRLLHSYGERHARDLRGLYSADLPFTNDFFVAVIEEWRGYIHARLGLTKKCLVLDLDNTLWGGILGEVGPLGIELGPEYPGLAYQNFQRALLELHERGIILAINSRNNLEDVREVFSKNPHMILKEEHFAAVRINWQDKAKNIEELAHELNIGTDSMVFIDDDTMNRDLVHTRFPEVEVPEWNMPPEEYVHALLSLKAFYQFRLTEEDQKKGHMYAQEKQRKKIQQSSQTIDDYIDALRIKLKVSINDLALIKRMSQMSLKTNQFNLTTKRYSEKEIFDYIAAGAAIYAADVSDKFGEYGITLLAIVTKPHEKIAQLDTFLMSCRVMGRGVEYSFIDFILRDLRERGVEMLEAQFIPTAKNIPAKDFLSSLSVKEKAGFYHIALKEYFRQLPKGLKSSIAIMDEV